MFLTALKQEYNYMRKAKRIKNKARQINHNINKCLFIMLIFLMGIKLFSLLFSISQAYAINNQPRDNSC